MGGKSKLKEGCLPVLGSICRQDLDGVAVQSTTVDVSIHGDTSWCLPNARLKALPLIEVVLADIEESGAGCVGELSR